MNYYTKTILLIYAVLFLVSCGSIPEDSSYDVYEITDSVGRVEGYVRSDGAITDDIGRVKGYIEDH